MQPTLRALAAPRQRGRGGAGAIRFRASWTTPGLSSHQMLDAGVGARQHAARKALKKSKRPFDNYFKVEFRRSQGFRLPRISHNGTISARDAARLMTNPHENWRAPWDGTLWRLAKTRTDVVEAAAPAFGDDPVDMVVDQLIDIRFEWDKEDDVVAPSLVPESLYALTAHCAPYATNTTTPPSPAPRRTDENDVEKTGREGQAQNSPNTDGNDADTDTVFLADGTPVQVRSRRRRHPAYRRVKNAGGHPKRTYRKPNLGFNGVDAVPSLVADAVRGPLLSSCTEPVLTVRWKAANRDTASVAKMLQLRRRVSSVLAVGLTPRVALLLLKAAAAEELEDPALEVSLAVAMGENYGGYTAAECLEVLRGLRRLALVRYLPAFSASASPSSSASAQTAVTTSSATTSSASLTGTAADLYRDARLVPRALCAYVEDTAPFLTDKVWSRLPDHSRHLLHDQLYLDWLDLVSLAVEIAGSDHLPENLPNPSSHAPYAAKYLFLRHTLGLDVAAVEDMVSCLQSSAAAAEATHHGGHTGLYVDDEKELVGRPRILWLAAALLVRLTAEALGDVLRHVQHSLHDHAQLAAETLEASPNPSVEMAKYLDRIALARPRAVEPYRAAVAGTRARRGGLRVRLLPFAAFPEVVQLRPAPFQSVVRPTAGRPTRTSTSRRALAVSDARSSSSSGDAPLESVFATVFVGSAQLKKHVERATAALEWATGILRACHTLVKPLTRSPPPSEATAPQSSSTQTVAEGEDGSVGLRRQNLCGTYVRSRVETQMDTLFTCIPWSNLLEGNGLQSPWLPAEDTTDAEVEVEAAADELASALAEEAKTTSAEGEGRVSAEEAAADVLAMMLEEDVSALEVATTEAEKSEAIATPATTSTADADGDSEAPPCSEAEMAMRTAMQGLNDALGDFEVAVADVLDCYEDYFDLPRKPESEPLLSSPESS